jgi:uncharacterized protein (TIGR03435 family)
MRLATIVAVLCVACCAQNGSGTLTFEAASIKPAGPPMPGESPKPLNGGPGTNTPTRFAGSASMKALLVWAYGVKPERITGPSWMDSERYEVAATLRAGASDKELEQMLQNLLVERFHLAVHRETKELAIYALVLGKNGPKLKESDPSAADADDAAVPASVRPRVTIGPDGFPQIPPGAKTAGSFTLTLAGDAFIRIKMFMRNKSMGLLAGTLTDYVNRPVQDFTGLQKEYDFTLAFEADPRMTPGDTDSAVPGTGPNIFTAVQEQLGLKLEPRKARVDLLIVDRVDRTPMEN